VSYIFNKKGCALTVSDNDRHNLLRPRLRLSRMPALIAMGVLFYGVLTPVAIIMRWAGKDVLRLRLEPTKSSYWLPRPSEGKPQTSMKSQF
jgi:hypothetical protein